MKCLKCGQELKDQNVFCRRCLDLMEAYPVKSDVHIQLPNRTEAPVQKKRWRKRRQLSVSEQLRFLRRSNRWLVAAVVVLSLLLILVSSFLIALANQNDPNIGKNYTYESTES